MAELHATTAGDDAGITAPCTVRLRPEARQVGPDTRAVLYLLEIAEEGRQGATLRLRSAMQFPELARVGRGLRRLVRAGEPFAGLALGWSVTLRGEPTTAGSALTFTVEQHGATKDFPLLATGPAVETFVDTLEAEVTALP